jgi:hypothetical protein
MKTNQDGTKTMIPSGNMEYDDDQIISFDSDGFTVGDGTGGVGNYLNVNARVYTYTALEA